MITSVPIIITNPLRHNAAPMDFIFEHTNRYTNANRIGTTVPTYA